ncbi:hypothetical protein P3L10_026560 [Capsicum annuum]|uniref:uncharacterized protein LOC124887068 n=1 Tax=Capsicum annuum TaxID=4072 RepID=UPI001FB04D94|nr:uncharacterized protein LOC124887068 [Capsicum annuum]
MVDCSPDSQIPPEPPNKGVSNAANLTPVSYNDILKAHTLSVTSSLPELLTDSPMFEPNDSSDVVSLTTEDKEWIYEPWYYTIIMKAVGRRFNHQHLRKKLADLWKITDPFPLINLGKDFYTAKFNREDLQRKVLQQSPWFIDGAYLFIRSWVSNFIPNHSRVLTTAIWVRLPELPIEFYDTIILEKVGRMIGSLVKVDACTSATLRGYYTRICVQIPMDA